MKWVLKHYGTYKLVEDSDPRPEVKLPNKGMGKIFTPYSPSWKKHEKNMWHEDTKTSQEATDKFIEEREHEIKTDPKAARWEKSRKATWEKDKPAWRKWATKKGII